MAMRMTGLMSGMDTESLIQELVSARQVKVDKVKKAQTKQEWKQDAWKDLNTKLKNLQSKYISNLRYTTSYGKKTTKVSNNSAVNVITGEGAMNGVQELEVKQLAKTGYMTGGKLGDSVTALTTMEELGLGADFAGKLTVTTGGVTKDVDLTGASTISDVLTKLQEAGVNANFDATQKRFYISAKESGQSGDFTIGGDASVVSALGLNSVSKEQWDAMSDEQKAANQNLGIKINGQNAIIELNGATYTNNTNAFSINGLTITALAETKGEKVTVTTQDDVDGIYDMLKNFLKEYNAVINEIDKLYNAKSAKGYEPMTEEEKDALSEREVEKYEAKIKDALLRNDDTLSSIRSALKETMSSGITVGDETLYLSDFGIETLGYFDAPDNEKSAYHIAGDQDDAASSGKTDVLKGLIASDPNKVIDFFTKLSNNLYDKMSSLSSSVDGYRTFGSFYEDKKMKADYDEYTTKIKELEEKLADYEDKWYKKFSAMETTLAKMQSNTNALAGLIGG